MFEHRDYDEIIEEKDLEVKEGESKHDAFVRICTPRVQKAAKAIGLIANCAGSRYEYTPDEVNKMFDFLQSVLDDARGKFDKETVKDTSFTF